MKSTTTRSAPESSAKPTAVTGQAVEDRAAVKPSPRAVVTPGVAPESRGARFARRARRTRLYIYAFLGVALLAYVVALADSNTRRVRVDWVFGSSSVRLVWLVTLAAILGWLLGLLVAGIFRWRTRAPRSARAANSHSPSAPAK